MAMFMYVCRVFISLLLFLVHCEVTVEQATQGPLDKICTTTWFNEDVTIIPPLAKEDEHVINTLLGCSRNGKSRPSCFIDSDAVTCDCYPENHTRCRVVIIDFSNRRLEGTIPENIGDLRYLKRLYLNRNKLHGSIPKSFPKLTNLSDLSLCDNSLEGPIPSFFGQMTSLRNIDLCKNFFDQKIPAELSSLPYLEYLDLSYNFLSDKIPNELGNIKRLIGLYLSDNQLSGVIPSQLGKLVNLEKLNLKNNEFIGPLPSSFKNLTKLMYFNVRGNNLNETKLDIIEQWQDLRYMNLMGNNISSPFHGQFPKLKNLTTLYISDLVGKSSSFPNISEMESLRDLTLRNCKIADPIPDWIWNLSGLRYLDLSFNSLVGPIPEVVGNSLKYIFLRRNNLTGTIPAWMTASTRYRWKNNSEKIPVLINVALYVDVSDNNFRNVNISDREKLNSKMNLFECCPNAKNEVAKWDQVDFHCKSKSGTQIYDRLYINCGGESLSVNGRDYEADLHPHGESTFFKSNRSNWGYSSMGRFSSARRDKYILNESCQGDAQLYATARVSPISLKYYGFCLKTGNYEVKLHFSEISSSKNISHSKAGRLFDVDIQGENKLRNFNIEKQAGGLDKAITMVYTANVNNGRLEIHLYWSGKGSTLYPSEYYGPLISAITVTPVYEPDQSEMSNGKLAGISGFAFLLLILFIGFSWRFQDKLRREELELVELYPGGLYNYRKIKAATKNFDIANRLGEGGFGTVYKGTLSNKTAVAVKKLSATKEGMCEFAEKSRAIAGMEHPNLVTLIGCCAGKNQLLLIYEYIGTNTLEDALFGSDELRARLDWPTRYRICLGLAEGLSFLHEGSKQEIIHGDIKPANILLDDDLNPKIYDFGFAKLYHKQKSEGTMSYTAPEVKDRPLEANADVYSFGIVTLILVSGKKIKTPRAGGDTEYLVDEAQKKDRKGTVMELVDHNLNYVWEEAEMILRLAMQCIDSPPFRPNMSTIVKILKKERSIETILIKAPKPEGDFSM